MNKKTDTTTLIIKLFEGIILMALAIVFFCFVNDHELASAISYCIATVLLIFGILTICFCFLLGKGVISMDTLSGSVLVALGILIFAKPEIVRDYLGLLFGIIIIVYATSFLIEGVISLIEKIKLKDKNVFRPIIYLVFSVLLIVAGVLLLIFNNDKSNDESVVFTNVVVGIAFIIAGAMIITFAILSYKESKNIVEKPSKTSLKPAKKEKSKKKAKELPLIDTTKEKDEVTVVDDKEKEDTMTSIDDSKEEPTEVIDSPTESE